MNSGYGVRITTDCCDNIQRYGEERGNEGD